MSLFALFFGLMSGCFLSVLVGIVGSKRRIGFGWAFLASLFLTPLVGLLLALISDPLPVGTDRGLGVHRDAVRRARAAVSGGLPLPAAGRRNAGGHVVRQTTVGT